MQIDFAKIKLIIWDLDNTLWDGILSEGEVVPNQEAYYAIKKTDELGIVNSICSKNDYEQAKRELEKNEMFSYFVFPSIDFSSKGERVKSIITSAALRPVNVLFVDDESINRQEVSFFNSGILTASPKDAFESLHIFFKLAESDGVKRHSRLEQYKQIEKKIEVSHHFSDPVSFLLSCHIQVTISKPHVSDLDRIFELIQRSNQLNFTKKRLSLSETKILLENPLFSCGLISCQDDFGDYGTIGFYALKDGVLEHFLFSCRCLGMHVEQYVYEQLNFPSLTIVPDVAVQLDRSHVSWINSQGTATESNVSHAKKTVSGEVLFKGPCDMEMLFPFIKWSKKFKTEFTYVSPSGCTIYQRNHSDIIVETKTLSEREKSLLGSLPFSDPHIFDTSIFEQKNGFVILSMIPDGNFAVYQDKDSGILIPFGEWNDNLEDSETRQKFLLGKLYTGQFKTNSAFLEDFLSHFHYTGRIPISRSISNLSFIRSHMHKETGLVLLLGSTVDVPTSQAAYKDRFQYHKKLNSAIEEWQKTVNGVFLIHTSDFAPDLSFYTNNLNHYSKHAYEGLANEVCRMIMQNDSSISLSPSTPIGRLRYKISHHFHKKTF